MEVSASRNIEEMKNNCSNNLEVGSEEGFSEHQREFPNLSKIRESLALAETLAKASLMTSPAAKRRLAVRKIQITAAAAADNNYDNVNNNASSTDNNTCNYSSDPAPPVAGGAEYVPPKAVLLYLVRMGSFTSAPKILNEDAQDSDIALPPRMTRSEILERCRCECAQPLLRRSFKGVVKDVGVNIADDFKILQINGVSKICVQPLNSPDHIRIFQWNVLSQSLGTTSDSFICCPDDALEWANRRYQIVQEILEYAPDVICLQEVDHFKFLKTCLETQGYDGMFFPKPDSPCLYLDGNNGPDGCAVFYRRDKFDFVKSDTRVLEVWRVQSNQVAVAVVLRVKETGREFLVAGTHLKARSGALLSTLRNEQGKDLLDFVTSTAEGRPVILCGDFNAEPTEPIYRTVLGHQELNLGSAYADFSSETDIPSIDREPPYTTWKVRDEGEVCHTIDYVFYNKDVFAVNAVLQFPTSDDIGEGRVPSFRYPSDHFSLCCDLRFHDQEKSEQSHAEELEGTSSL